MLTSSDGLHSVGYEQADFEYRLGRLHERDFALPFAQVLAEARRHPQVSTPTQSGHNTPPDDEERMVRELMAALDEGDTVASFLVLKAAYEDNWASATPIGVEGREVSVLMSYPRIETVLSATEQAVTPGGRLTLRNRTKTEQNRYYAGFIVSSVMATAKEAFQVLPKLEKAHMIAVWESEVPIPDMQVIALGCLPRQPTLHTCRAGTPESAMQDLWHLTSVLKRPGRTDEIVPIGQLSQFIPFDAFDQEEREFADEFEARSGSPVSSLTDLATWVGIHRTWKETQEPLGIFVEIAPHQGDGRHGPVTRTGQGTGSPDTFYTLSPRQTPDPKPGPTPEPTPSEDPVALLHRLAQLVDRGVLSQEEFLAQKRRLLEGR